MGCNFQPGLTGYNKVLEHPNGINVIVISGGTGYIINPKTKELFLSFGAQIDFCVFLQETENVLCSNGVAFEIIPKQGKHKHTARISWDGIRNIKVEKNTATGEAYDPMQHKWLPFSVDLEKQTLTGGSFAQ